MANKRVLKNVTATLSVLLTDSDGAPREADDVTVSARRGDGTVVFASRPAEVGPESGQYITTLTVADTAKLDEITLTWLTNDGATYTTIAEVVGGYYFSPDEARNAAPGLSNTEKYPTELIVATRTEVEEELERITNRAFVPRYRRVEFDGRAGLWLPNIDVRSIRRLTVDGVTVPASVGPFGDMYPLQAFQVANAGPGYGYNRLGRFAAVEYEYGTDEPPADLKRAALLRFVSRIGLAKSGVPDRNEYQFVDGQMFSVTQPGVRGSLTGIREVDVVYQAYAMSRDVMAVRIGG